MMGPRTIDKPITIEGGSRPHRIQVLDGECVYHSKAGKKRHTLEPDDEAVTLDYHTDLTPIGRAVVTITPL